MTKKKFFIWMPLILGIAFAFAAMGCDDAVRPPPGSVDYYSSQEPDMAPNPSRGTVRAGGTSQIGIPDYLLSGMFPSISRASAYAEFEVYSEDSDIAEIVSQNGSTCQIRGLKLGSARIKVTVGSESATMIIAVSPSDPMYTLPAGQVKSLGTSTFYEAWWTSDQPSTDGLPNDYEDYHSEPTYSLAWIWRNRNDPIENFHAAGLSGYDSGIDMMAYYVDPLVPDRRGWVMTTYKWGGWHYDLNGVNQKMNDGFQEDSNVKLQLVPEFVYDNGVPYLQITHQLTNKTGSTLTGQKFGASADVMINDMDEAPVSALPYGALMTNEVKYGSIHYLPTLKYRLVCQGIPGIIDNVTTMWIGEYGDELANIYTNHRVNISFDHLYDSALAFSYQNITLAAYETKEFVIRFTQVQ